jgi:hypothetical protein
MGLKKLTYKPQVLIGSFFVIVSANIFAAMPLNTEVKCETVQMTFYVNGKQTSSSSPTDVKPTYYRFDGKQLSAYYKFANAPVPAANGAKFISRENSQDAGRTFDVTKFEKIGSDNLVTKLQFIKEVGGKTTALSLMDAYSQNNFASFGRNLNRCEIEK